MDNRSPLEAFLATEPSQTELLPWLEVKTMSRLARMRKSIHGLFQDTLLIERLAHFIIVSPNAVEVINMVKAHPWLLDTNIPKVFNRKGQLIRNNKPFSLAFGAGDDEICAVLKEEMIRYYGSLEAAETEIRMQVNEKIGENNKEQDDQIKNQLAALLTAVIQAITNEPFNLGRDHDHKKILNPATHMAITVFREGLAALQPKIIDKGMHFRLNTLLETFDAYAQAATNWRDNFDRCFLFESGVLSSVLSYLPENDAQRGSQGLYHLQKDEPEDFARSLKLRGTNIDFYDRLRRVSSYFSNFSGCGVDIIFGTCVDGRALSLAGGGRRWGCRFVKTYVEQKLQTYRAYAAEASPDGKLCHFMMYKLLEANCINNSVFDDDYVKTKPEQWGCREPLRLTHIICG